MFAKSKIIGFGMQQYIQTFVGFVEHEQELCMILASFGCILWRPFGLSNTQTHYCSKHPHAPGLVGEKYYRNFNQSVEHGKYESQ